MLRTCKDCGETKELELFVKSKNMKYGYANKCKDCKNKERKERRLVDTDFRERERKACEKSRVKSKETGMSRIQEWKKNNAERVKEYQRKYKERVKEKKVEDQIKFNSLLSGVMDELRKEGSTCGN